ncbi:hypothetical protein C8R44DRAFT_899621 [Mycena epipterygia]|nr:hypothetical protein C8R44DRAFT_899621 [Mycena epipterygia]
MNWMPKTKVIEGTIKNRIPRNAIESKISFSLPTTTTPLRPLVPRARRTRSQHILMPRMAFFPTALLLLALASFAPQASAIILVVHHSGLSDTTRIVIIFVAIVLFLLLCACRLARIRQNRIARASALAALPSVAVPVGTTQVAPNYASQGTGGYNGYTLPLPLPPPGPRQYPPPQGYPFPGQPQNYVGQGQGQPGYYAPQGYTLPYTLPAYAPDAEKGYGMRTSCSFILPTSLLSNTSTDTPPQF